ncbi:MAG TPA: extracellular solute-binding protein [Chloroflexota bacterium]|nr:extracellular solute-binding protein [Chloroflexota bacterium]
MPARPLLAGFLSVLTALLTGCGGSAAPAPATSSSASYDPRGAGAALSTFTFFYSVPSLGKSFIEALLKQDVTISKDATQVSDWVARGEYPIGIAGFDDTALQLKQKGAPIDAYPPDALKEGAYVTTGWGSLAVFNKAPHPNATKVYLDWLLSVDGQQAVAQAQGFPSLRKDVPVPAGLPSFVVPKDGVQYVRSAKESWVRLQGETTAYLKTVMTN